MRPAPATGYRQAAATCVCLCLAAGQKAGVAAGKQPACCRRRCNGRWLPLPLPLPPVWPWQVLVWRWNGPDEVLEALGDEDEVTGRRRLVPTRRELHLAWLPAVAAAAAARQELLHARTVRSLCPGAPTRMATLRLPPPPG